MDLCSINSLLALTLITNWRWAKQGAIKLLNEKGVNAFRAQQSKSSKDGKLKTIFAGMRLKSIKIEIEMRRRSKLKE